MNKLLIKATKDSPEINFDPKTNIFSISGVSHPENVTRFFDPVMEWLDEYLIYLKEYSLAQPIKLIVFFKYINSASYKYFINFLQKMQEFQTSGIPVNVEWVYEFEDYDMRDSGSELFEYSGIQLPFTIYSKDPL